MLWFTAPDAGMSQLTVRLLGGFEVRAGDGHPLAVPTRKAQALLAYLALTPGQTHPRDKLAALLWADAAPGVARNALRQTLFVLRKALGSTDGGMLLATGDAIALPPEAVQTDVAAFERAVSTGTPAGLEEAATLYGGDLLAGLGAEAPEFEDWLMSERERLRELAIEALARRLAQQRAAGATDAAVQLALRLLALDPLQEAVHRTLMQLYARQGRRGAALRQYQVCVSVLQRELGAEPEGETKQLYQQVLRERSAVAAAADAATTVTGGPGTAEMHAPGGLTGRQPSTPERPAAPPPVTLPEGEVLVGREGELETLHQALDDSLNGRGRMVMVIGDAGIGKTSVLRALAAEAVRRGTRVLIGRSYESEQILPFAPWVDAFRTGLALEGDDTVRALSPIWRSELARLFPEVAAPDLPPPSDDQRRLFESVAHLVEQLARGQPLALLLEDLHWADEMSLRLLSFLGRRISSKPVLMIATARTEELLDAALLRRTLDELAQASHYGELSLSPLSRDDTARLVRFLSRPSHGVEAVTRLEEQVWGVSEGNPFVIVETLRALGGAGAGRASPASSVPRSVRAMIASRLERLGSPARGLAAVAAIIGREFDFALLARAAEMPERDAAEALEELVRRRVLDAVGGRFDFTHDRIREVVSSQLLPARRKLVHGAVARALEALHAENLEPHYSALGLHYREAELPEKAVIYLRHAGRVAAARSALQDARMSFDQALDALAVLPENRSTLEQTFEIRLELRSTLMKLGEVRRVLDCLSAAETLAEKLNDNRLRGQIFAFKATAYTLLADIDKALAAGAHAQALAQATGDLELRIPTGTSVEQVYWFRGDYERVVELAIDNLACLPAERADDHFGTAAPVSVYDRYWLILSLVHLGRFAEAARYEAEAARLAGSTPNAYTTGIVHLAATRLHLQRGEWVAALSPIEKGLTLFRDGQVSILLPEMVASSAWTLAQLGQPNEALKRLQEGEQLLESLIAKDLVGLLGWSSFLLGQTCLLMDRVDAARSLADRVVESCRGQHGDLAHALYLLGGIASHGNGFDAEGAHTRYREALALAESRSMRPLVAHCHRGLGKLFLRIGNREQASEQLTTAMTMYRDMDMRFWLEQAEAEMREVRP